MLTKYGDILNIDDICKILHISKKSAYQLLKNNEIAFKRIGRIYRIRKDALIEYLNK